MSIAIKTYTRDECIEREIDLISFRIGSYRNFSMRLYHDVLSELIQEYNKTFNNQQLKSFLRRTSIDEHIRKFCEFKDLSIPQINIRYSRGLLLFINALRKDFDQPIVESQSLVDKILSWIYDNNGIHNLKDNLYNIVGHNTDFDYYSIDDNQFFMYKQRHTYAVIFNMRQAVERGFFKNHLCVKTLIICDDLGDYLLDKENTFNISDVFIFNQRRNRLEQYSFDNIYQIIEGEFDIWLNTEKNDAIKKIINELKNNCLKILLNQPIDWYLAPKNKGYVDFDKVIYEINHYSRILSENKLTALTNIVIIFKSYLDTNMNLYSVLKDILSCIRQNSSLYVVKGKIKDENNLFSEENLTAILSLGLKSFFNQDDMVNISTEEPSGNGRTDLNIKIGRATVGIVESKLVKKKDNFQHKVLDGINQLLDRYGNNYFFSYDAQLHLYLIVFCHDKKFYKIDEAISNAIDIYAKRNRYQYEVLHQGENEVTFLFKLYNDPNSFFQKQQRYLTIFVCNLEYFHERSAENLKNSTYTV